MFVFAKQFKSWIDVLCLCTCLELWNRIHYMLLWCVCCVSLSTSCPRLNKIPNNSRGKASARVRSKRFLNIGKHIYLYVRSAQVSTFSLDIHYAVDALHFPRFSIWWMWVVNALSKFEGLNIYSRLAILFLMRSPDFFWIYIFFTLLRCLRSRCFLSGWYLARSHLGTHNPRVQNTRRTGCQYK